MQVSFSPRGGCTEAIVDAIHEAKTEVLVQAYSFTSALIAKALVDAHKRGVQVQIILDRSKRTENYGSELPPIVVPLAIRGFDRSLTTLAA